MPCRFLFSCALAVGISAPAPLWGQIVINEIHYHPDVESEPVEFVELHNPGTHAVNVAGWSFSSGLKYGFSSNAVISAHGFLVVARDPAALKKKYGAASVGPYEGRLSHRGEKIVLRDASGKIQDEVDYQLGFPWPTVGDAPGPSIELIHPALDNSLGGNWLASSIGKVSRTARPTPGAQNSVFATNSPPQLRQVRHVPKEPGSNVPVQISVKASDAEGLQNVTLYYQVVEPGRYCDLNDVRYKTNWTSMPMQPASEKSPDVYVAEIPAAVQKHRRLIRYRISAADKAGAKVRAPYDDDPQPNFAYFVYDGVPPWKGAIQPAAKDARKSQMVEFGTNVMRQLPVYQLLSKHESVEQSNWLARKSGHDYPWLGTLVYDGKVYDHIRFRARGGGWRYAMGKNMWKFEFNRGHDFQARDGYGRKYEQSWRKLNLGACIQQADYGHRGEQGMFEAVGFRLFNLAGVEAPHTHWLQFRVIDEPEESKNQYTGDFWGLYLAVEQMDGRFLDEHHLPDDNLYKMEYGSGKLGHKGPRSRADNADLTTFMRGYQRNLGDEWWRKNVDLPRYYSYRSVVEAIHHYDIDEGPGKNYFYLHNPNTGRWSVHPWDIDLTWADNMYGSGQSPFYRRVLPRVAFRLEYQNRLRELRDLLLNPEQAGELIDEYASMIFNPGAGPSIVEADRALWDHNPVMSDSRRSMPGKADAGRFYEAAATKDFPGMVRLMKNYAAKRFAWIDRNLLNDSSIPATPAVANLGSPELSKTNLAFRCSSFGGPGQFASLQWRMARVSDAEGKRSSKSSAHYYEIEPAWESGEITTGKWEVTVPSSAVKAALLYRVRVRMKDSAGKWSHWSPPIQFKASP